MDVRKTLRTCAKAPCIAQRHRSGSCRNLSRDYKSSHKRCYVSCSANLNLFSANQQHQNLLMEKHEIVAGDRRRESQCIFTISANKQKEEGEDLFACHK